MSWTFRRGETFLKAPVAGDQITSFDLLADRADTAQTLVRDGSAMLTTGDAVNRFTTLLFGG